MIKRLILSTTLMVISFSVFSQLSFSAAMGMKDTSGWVGRVGMNYEWNRIGISSGIAFTRPGRGSVLFTAETFLPVKFDDHSGMLLHGGYAFRMVSADNKELNGHEWIVGSTMEWMLGDVVRLGVDVSYTERHSIIFLLTFRGILCGCN